MMKVFNNLTKDMSDFTVWKIDKLTDLKVWWFVNITLKLTNLVTRLKKHLSQ